MRTPYSSNTKQLEKTHMIHFPLTTKHMFVNYCNKRSHATQVNSHGIEASYIAVSHVTYHAAHLFTASQHYYFMNQQYSKNCSIAKIHDFIFTKLTRLLLEVPTRYKILKLWEIHNFIFMNVSNL